MKIQDDNDKIRKDNNSGPENLLRFQYFVVCFQLSLLLTGPSGAAEELRFPEGTYYGDTYKGMRHGYGVFYWSHGSVFEGNWVLGKRHGHGTYTSVSGQTTPVYYVYDELSVDYSTLPDDYVISVCSLITNLMMADVNKYYPTFYDQSENDLQVTVTVNYKEFENEVGPNLTSYCKFAYNEKSGVYEMTEAKIEDTIFSSEDAKELGITGIHALYMPRFEEETEQE
ncbi:MAG: hypothetical protein AAGF54_14580 [Pseudomonadota bacterium]